MRYFSTLYVFLIIGLIIHNISCHEFVYQKRQPISTPLLNSDYNELYDWQNVELRKPDGGVELSKSGKSQAAFFSPSVERATKMLDQLNFQVNRNTHKIHSSNLCVTNFLKIVEFNKKLHFSMKIGLKFTVFWKKIISLSTNCYLSTTLICKILIWKLDI